MTTTPEGGPLPSAGVNEHYLRQNRLLEALDGDRSGFTGIVLGGAYVEHYVRSAIRNSLPNADRFLTTGKGEEYNHDFMTLLKLARAFDVIGNNDYELLKRFARLRNRFAHGVDEYLYSESNRAALKQLIQKWSPDDSESEDIKALLLARYESANDNARNEAVFQGFRLLVFVISSMALGAHKRASELLTVGMLEDAFREAEAGDTR